MVFAFLCQSVTSTPCRILYSAVYGEDMHTALSQGISADGLRKVRKDQLMQVACRVQAEYGFRMEAKDRVPRGHVREESMDKNTSYEKGYLRLSAGDPFSTINSVIWQVCESCAFVMILNSDENRILAESVLSIIIRIVNDHVLSLEQKIAEIMLKGEKVSTILHVLLPNGQLLFMNHKLIKQFERQIENILTTK